MDLNGEQRKQLHDALCRAFPDWPSLERMVAFGLEANLAEIADSKNLSNAAFDLIKWAQSRGRLAVLITAAQAANPTNPELNAFISKLPNSHESLLKKTGFPEGADLKPDPTESTSSTDSNIDANSNPHAHKSANPSTNRLGVEYFIFILGIIGNIVAYILQSNIAWLLVFLVASVGLLATLHFGQALHRIVRVIIQVPCIMLILASIAIPVLAPLWTTLSGSKPNTETPTANVNMTADAGTSIAHNCTGIAQDTVAATPTVAGQTTLGAGQQLAAGSKIISPDGRYCMVMQPDGNLVVSNDSGIVWASKTNNAGSTAKLQADGNFVIYNAEHIAVWASNTDPGSPATLVGQDDGNFVLYRPGSSDRVAVWSTYSGNRIYNNPGGGSATSSNGSLSGCPDLRLQLAGPCVVLLQHDLNLVGSNPKLTESGLFTPETYQSVWNFQSNHNLQVDGIAGPQTNVALINALSLPTPTTSVFVKPREDLLQFDIGSELVFRGSVRTERILFP